MGLPDAGKLSGFAQGAAVEFGFPARTDTTRSMASSATSGAGASSLYASLGLKRALDIVVALTALLLILPLMPLIVLALLIQDGPKIIFRQARVGIDGSTFECLKFRSMALDADARMAEVLRTCAASRAEWESMQKLRVDPRIHRVGHILRKSSLDEIPQLINVLRGDMSIVGPRPMLPEQVQLYGSSINSYTSVRPGITGLWQVSGRNTLTFEQRVALDGRYSANVTFLGDLKILARTVVVVLMGHGSC